jgi:glyoxylase-like metal-dependent hydrolase (beta-lactamase superfamily II)
VSALPATVKVLERGWLSANNILLFDGDAATMIDSGYVSHAEQTVALVRQALGGKRLSKLVNTHSHSDHIGGNAAVQSAFGCPITIPADMAGMVADWDVNALLLAPLGQHSEPFAADATVADGESFVAGELTWNAIAAPGHDMSALIYHAPDARLLISGDALWEDGFGVVFSELAGVPDAFAITRETLDRIGRLAVDHVIPGHGAPFTNVERALNMAHARLDAYMASPERFARHALKVLLVFLMLDRGRVRRADLPELVASLPMAHHLNSLYLQQDLPALALRTAAELLVGGVWKDDGEGWLRG